MDLEGQNGPGGAGQSGGGGWMTATGTGWSQGGWTALAACLCLHTLGCKKDISGTVSSSLFPRAPQSGRALPWVQGVESLPVNPGRSCSLGAALWWPVLVMASVSVVE